MLIVCLKLLPRRLKQIVKVRVFPFICACVGDCAISPSHARLAAVINETGRHVADSIHQHGVRLLLAHADYFRHIGLAELKEIHIFQNFFPRIIFKVVSIQVAAILHITLFKSEIRHPSRAQFFAAPYRLRLKRFPILWFMEWIFSYGIRYRQTVYLILFFPGYIRHIPVEKIIRKSGWPFNLEAPLGTQTASGIRVFADIKNLRYKHRLAGRQIIRILRRLPGPYD